MVIVVGPREIWKEHQKGNLKFHWESRLKINKVHFIEKV